MRIIVINLLFFVNAFAMQANSLNRSLVFPIEKIKDDFNSFKKIKDKSFNKKGLSFFLRYNSAVNDGHPNIDNYSEFYASSKYTRMISANFQFNYQWIKFEIEPYHIQESLQTFEHKQRLGTYSFNNNFSMRAENSLDKVKLASTKLIIHSESLYISYGKMRHWWGPGIHNTFAISTNFPSTISYSFGTFKDITFGPIQLGAQIIVMPYKSLNDTQLFFSGLNGYLVTNKYPKITIGFNRTYLSGNFDNLESITH